MAVISNPCAENDSRCLYNNETNSDVTFIAGFDGDTWRFPGHRNILAKANEVFGAMLKGSLANETVIRINDVDKKAFQVLLRYLYGLSPDLPSVLTARATLDVANKYLCLGLVKECVTYLDLNLTSSNVLEVFQNLRFYCSRVPTSSTAPSAPPLQILSTETETDIKMTEFFDSLLHNCLLFIDEKADEVFKQELIEELSYEDIATISQRETLKLTNELDLFEALDRWCVSKCQRKKRELTSANKRQLLGQLSYCPRYLLMTEAEFISGPKNSELLDLVECDLILARMRGDPEVKFTLDQERMLQKFATPRITEPLASPIVLSERSVPRTPVNTKKSKNEKIKKKKKKDKKKEKMKDDKEDKDGCCSCFCFGDTLCRILINIFD